MSVFRHLTRLNRPLIAQFRSAHGHPTVVKTTSRPPPIGPMAGEQSDPEIYNDNPPMPGEEAHWTDYRDNVGKHGVWDEYLSVWLSAAIWGYISYMFYWHSDIFFMKEFYQPEPTIEFTDAELGIPKDDEPDPEYWGTQQPK